MTALGARIEMVAARHQCIAQWGDCFAPVAGGALVAARCGTDGQNLPQGKAGEYGAILEPSI